MRPNHPIFPSVRSQVVRSLIIAYQEDTSGLERALAEEGLAPKVLRPTYTERELTYSRAIRCLLNHAAAWREARDPDGMTLIMEADFVPCTGFGRLPLPFDPQQQVDAAWAFLYTAGPRIFRCFPDGSLQGHSATPVAYVVTPRVACLLTDYVKEELARQGDLTRYSLWDTQFQWHIMGKGAACFMPYRSYGEHGGLPNAEHHREGIGVATRLRFLSRLGLGRNHHADALHGPLRFLPAYAAGNQGRFFLTRIEAKLTGWLKLLAGRVVAAEVSLPLNEQLRLRWMSLKRLCCFY